MPILTPAGPDDTAAIQSAIDNIGLGGTVQLGPGTFQVSKLRLRSSVSLAGAGRAATTLQPLPGANNGNVIELVDSCFNTISDLTIGTQNVHHGVVPNCGIFIGMGALSNTNLINIERVFVSHFFAWGALWNQGGFGVSVRDSQFWNYHAAYSVCMIGEPQLPSVFQPISPAVHPVNSCLMSNCEAHAMADGGHALHGSATSRVVWDAGAIMARTVYGSQTSNWKIRDPMLSCDAPGGNPIWI